VKYKVQILPEAEAQATELHRWWKRERPSSRVSVKQELRKLGKRLAEYPNRYPMYEDRDVRWCRLVTTPYLVFFRVDEHARQVEVVCLWSSNREGGPKLDS